MSFELLYTSVPKGLRAGTRGFCTAAFTEGMPSNYVELAESLSGYRNVFQPQDAHYALNPPALSHYQFIIGGERVSVLSRVCSCAVDYTGRTNKLAHHLFVRRAEMAEVGPAWIMSQPGMFQTEWKEEPHLIKTAKKLPAGQLPGFRATAWERLGDAGWAGALAQAATDVPARTVYIIFNPGTDLLPLIGEAFNLVAPDRRWSVTFNTYFTTLPQGTSCQWRCCLPDADALKELRRSRDALAIDLTKPLGKTTVTGPLVDCARSGVAPVWPKRATEVMWGAEPAAKEVPAKQGTDRTNAATESPVSRPATVRPDERAAGTTIPRLTIMPQARPAAERKLWPIIAITAGATAVIVLLLGGGIFMLMRPGNKEVTPVPPDPAMTMHPLEPTGVTGNESSPETSVESVPIQPLETKPPAKASESPPEPLPDKTPAPTPATLSESVTAPPQLHIKTDLIPPNSEGPWALPMDLGPEWKELKYDFYSSATGELDTRAEKKSGSALKKSSSFYRTSLKVDIEPRESRLDFSRNAAGSPDVGWVLVNFKSNLRHLLVVRKLTAQVTFEDVASGYRTGVLALPTNIACFLTSTTLTTRMSFPDASTQSVDFTAVPVPNGITFTFGLDATNKTRIKGDVINHENARAKAEWEGASQARPRTNALADLREELRKDKRAGPIREKLLVQVKEYLDAWERYSESTDHETVKKALQELKDEIILKLAELVKEKREEAKDKLQRSVDAQAMDKNPKAATVRKETARKEAEKAHKCAVTLEGQLTKIKKAEVGLKKFMEDVMRHNPPPTDNDLVLRLHHLESLLGFVRNEQGGFEAYNADCAIARLLSLPIPRNPPAVVVPKRDQILPDVAFILDRATSACILELRRKP